MADAVRHAEVVLGAIVGGRGSVGALRAAGRRIRPEHFEDSRHRRLYEMVTGYADRAGGILPRSALPDLLREEPPGTVAMYRELYAALAQARPRRDQFYHSLDQMVELFVIAAKGDALATALEILRHPEGVREEDGTVLRGHADASAYAMARLAEVEKDTGLELLDEGDVLADADAILAEYEAARAAQLAGKVPGVAFGFAPLDDLLDGGLHPGMMALVLAGTSVGKTSWCVQAAWDISVMQGKNVIFCTTEAARAEVRTKLVARHTAHPKFGLRQGLDDRAIRGGRLTADEEEIFRLALKDWQTGGYGRLDVMDMPDNVTVSGTSARIAARQRECHVDAVIFDYLQLCNPERFRRDARGHEDQAEIIKAFKRMVKARKVAGITPWQVNRKGRTEAVKNLLDHAADSDEAGRTPDLVLSLTNEDEDDESRGRARSQVLRIQKNRYGPAQVRFNVTADLACSRFEPADEAGNDLDFGEDPMEAPD